MSKPKAHYKVGDKFYHDEQKLFLVVDSVDYFAGRGYLYTLKCFNHHTNEISQTEPFKRYYEDKMHSTVTKLREINANKVLYGK